MATVCSPREGSQASEQGGWWETWEVGEGERVGEGRRERESGNGDTHGITPETTLAPPCGEHGPKSRQSRVPGAHEPGGCGRRNRRSPVGGAAYGMPCVAYRGVALCVC